MRTSNETGAIEPKGKIGRKELMSMFWRSCTVNASFNYERQMSQGFAYSMIPVLTKLYPEKDDLAEALTRHSEFFNITPGFATLAMGIAASMEEENASSDSFDAGSINAVKAALMGPLSGIGDSLYWGTLRPLVAGIACSIALTGNPIAPILFLVMFNVPNFLCKYICLFKGYEMGTSFLAKVQESGIMQKLFTAASIVGLMAIGAMSASMVSITLAPAIGSGDSAILINDVINGIMPKMLSLLAVLGIYKLVKKGAKVNTVLIGILVLGIVGCLVGLF